MTAVVILAAGLGKRMKSSMQKVMHTLFERPMLHYVIDAALGLSPRRIVVVAGGNHDSIKKSIKNSKTISFAVQQNPLGTANALLSAREKLKGFKGTVVVLNGDTPLIKAKTLKKFLWLHGKDGNSLSVASFMIKEPNPYGKILRDGSGCPEAIVEAPDRAPSSGVEEVNSGIYAIEPDAFSMLKDIGINKTKGEYYLTDLIGKVYRRGKKTGAYCIGSEEEFMGINTKEELIKARQTLRKRVVEDHARKDVDFVDARSVLIYPSVRIGKDTVIYPNVCIQGSTEVGSRCTIYPNVRIIDSILKDSVIVKDSTVIENSVIEANAQIGPFAHIRPESRIGESVKIGNFVEVKKSFIGKGTKAMHLSYLGDSDIGRNVNVGAGTITCNYDGVAKHRTVVEDGVFIGSDSQLVAPVRVRRGAYVGAGSTVTKDVPAMSLAIGRAEQKNIKGWVKNRLMKIAAHKKTKRK